MERRNKMIFLLVFSILLLILVIVLFVFFSPLKPKIIEEVNTNTDVGMVPLVNSGIVIANVSEEDKNEIKVDDSQAELSRLSASFAERFGSFSNQSDFSNLEELRPLMTDKMNKWVDEYISSASDKVEESGYKGVTTRAISVNILVLDTDKGLASIAVTTQRSEKNDLAEAKVYYQKLFLEGVKNDQKWLFDSAKWE